VTRPKASGRRLSPRFRQALDWAAVLHEHQLRKGGQIPYVAHLLGVASLVLEDGGSEDEAIAALLHDAVEDQDVTLAEIEDRFGPDVARIVDGATDSDEFPKPPWGPRKEAFLARLREQSPDVLRVVLADKLHNARATLWDYRLQGPKLWRIFHAGERGTLWFYREALAIFRERHPGPMTAELDRVIGELERLIAEGKAGER
jgi:GTP pyrophosphokinase